MQDIKALYQKPMKDVWKLWKASKLTFLYVAIISIIIGIAPLIQLLIVSGFLDALVGARALHVMTSDIESAVWDEFLLLIAILVSAILVHKLSGVAKRTAQVFWHSALIVSLMIAALPMAPIFIFVAISASIIAGIFQKWFISFPVSVVIVAYGAYKMYDIAEQSIMGSISMGDGILFSASILVLCLYFSLTPHHSFFKPVYESHS